MSHHSSNEGSGGVDPHAHGINIVEDLSPQLGADLDAQTNDLNNVGLINSLNIINDQQIQSDNLTFDNVAADFAWATTDTLYKVRTQTGSLLVDAPAGQLEFLNPPTTFFPTTAPTLWYNKMPAINGVLVAVARDAAGLAVAIGAERSASFGTQFAFTGDRMLYDPMCLRGGYIAPSWTRIVAKSHTENCFWNFKVSVDLRFAGAGLNGFYCRVKHYRSGALLRTYDVGRLMTNSPDGAWSFEKGINGGGFSEDVRTDDEFMFFTGCLPASANGINNLTIQRWEIRLTPKV